MLGRAIKANILADSSADSDATGSTVVPYGGLERNSRPFISGMDFRFNHRNDSNALNYCRKHSSVSLKLTDNPYL